MQTKTTTRYHLGPSAVLFHDMGGGFIGKTSLSPTRKDLCIPLSIAYFNKSVSLKKDVRFFCGVGGAGAPGMWKFPGQGSNLATEATQGQQ